MKFIRSNLHWLVLCAAAVAFLAMGGKRFRSANDFVPVYTGARCLLHGCNPYDTRQLEQQFYAAGGHPEELPSWEIDVPVYPPSTFLVLSPLALLRFPAARALWFLINGCLFITAAGFILSVCSPPHKWLATALASLFLLTSGILLVLGQPATLAISLVVIGSCLFMRGRLLALGAVLFLLSLTVKPQIGGLLVLYFLVRRIGWRYAATALVGALGVLLLAASILRAHPGSADWRSTLRANLSATLSPGGSADPRPENQQAVGDINLQALTSIFFKDARSLNGAAYAVFLLLLALWGVAALTKPAIVDWHFVPLAALAVLSLLPVYHRFYDTRLLVLTIPAVLIIFQRRHLLGMAITFCTVLAGISVQYRVQQSLLDRAQWQQVLHQKYLFLFMLRQQNLELLLLFSLYVVAMFSLRYQGQVTDSSSALQPALPLHR